MSTEKNERFDLDKDGSISSSDVIKSEKLIDLQMRESKSDAQRKMAWTSSVAMILFTVALFSPIIPIDRLEQLSDIMPLFYVAQAGIVGAYFGASAWMHSSK